ncbi:MAG: hypothetical protein ABI277_14300 [Burkholderiaceae bacterium]
MAKPTNEENTFSIRSRTKFGEFNSEGYAPAGGAPKAPADYIKGSPSVGIRIFACSKLRFLEGAVADASTR